MREGREALLSRRALVASAAATLFPYLPLSSRAQQSQIPLLGWLSSTPGSNPLFRALQAGLRDLNYIEGRSIRVEAYSAQDSAELRALARELVRQQVNVIVANGRAATRAAQEATTAWIETKGIGDVETPFAEALEKRATGILIVDSGALAGACDRIAAMALAHRIPAASSWRGDSETALLLSYAADNSHMQQRAASYVDRLLRGASPNDLPVEQASKFDLIVNLKVARKLDVTIPTSVLLRANEVID